MGKFGSLIEKDKKLYGNCQVLSPDGILMFRCDDKKVNWYLHRDLAEEVSADPKIIKLKFTPNGLGNHNKEYGLSPMENVCVRCGTEEFLTRHHVVPICYRRYFPVKVKSHNFHDVLSMCVDCHEEYEVHSFKHKKHLADKYDAPINGELIDNKEIMKAKKIAYSILFNPSIPNSKLKEMRKLVREHLGVKKLTLKKIKELSELDLPVYTRTHGEIVVSKLDNIQEFIQMWREHFIQNADCKFLPENWSIKNEFKYNG